ncbi:hypothetical protein MP228_003650 [Amoeboaphelidium protococcarum]|nr:hypothetical protein MP228_003650 [Amoeboaphelidium protococcarum]
MSLQVGQRVKVPSDAYGIIRYIGKTQFKAGVWVGIELESATGKNDGSVQGVRYFNCTDGHGLFVAYERILDLNAQQVLNIPSSLDMPYSPGPAVRASIPRSSSSSSSLSTRAGSVSQSTSLSSRLTSQQQTLIPQPGSLVNGKSSPGLNSDKLAQRAIRQPQIRSLSQNKQSDANLAKNSAQSIAFNKSNSQAGRSTPSPNKQQPPISHSTPASDQSLQSTPPKQISQQQSDQTQAKVNDNNVTLSSYNHELKPSMGVSIGVQCDLLVDQSDLINKLNAQMLDQQKAIEAQNVVNKNLQSEKYLLQSQIQSKDSKVDSLRDKLASMENLNSRLLQDVQKLEQDLQVTSQQVEKCQQALKDEQIKFQNQEISYQNVEENLRQNFDQERLQLNEQIERLNDELQELKRFKEEVESMIVADTQVDVEDHYYERDIDISQVDQQQQDITFSESMETVCSLCGEIGHLADQCADSMLTANAILSDVEDWCDICQSTQHHTSECPQIDETF